MMSLLKQSDGIDVVAAQQLWRRLIRLMPDGWCVAQIAKRTDGASCAGAQATFRRAGIPRLVMRLITPQAI
jgi:hypothetical protein